MRSSSRSAIAVAGLAVIALTSAADALADGITRTQLLAHTCTSCHGPEGLGSKTIPKIRGLERKEIVQSMKGFRSGEERQTIMGRIAQGYSDEDIELLAEFFSGAT